jgi:hypothetical protein
MREDLLMQTLISDRLTPHPEQKSVRITDAQMLSNFSEADNQ